MPYTPPSVQSPVASKPVSPALSRSQSYNNSHVHEKTLPGHGSRVDLPQSPSSRTYLSKHRRSPSISKSTSPAFDTGSSTTEGTFSRYNVKSSDGRDKSSSPEEAYSSTSGRTHNPSETSPSSSPQTSSDDEATNKRGRSQDVGKLAELQAAIKIIEQHRAGSPDGQTCEETKIARMALGLPAPRLDLSKLADGSHSELSPRLPLSAGARKISHSRSTTDATAFFDFPRNKFDSPAPSTSQSDDEDIEDDELRIKPALIRKKSGELVKPALRASSTRRRPSSMPGTPTYAKAVHFQDNSLEHVRHFLQIDRPIAVSAGTSPVDPRDDDDEFPFGNGEGDTRSPPFDWEIRLTNFPQDSVERQALPVWTEKVYLSPDTKVLIGSVVVRNLAFHKLVVARFTLDYWKTTSEVVAEYNNDVRKKQIYEGCDRFTFNIKLEDQANLENKTMSFCVKYNVNGQDYWDNNKSINYQVDFSRNFKPQNGKQGAQAKSSRPLNALPRSRPSTTFSGRPRSMPSFDDFAGMVSPYEFSSFPQPSAMVGDSPIQFKSKPSAKEIVPDAPGWTKGPTTQQAFGNRYDFGASLSAAIQAGSTANGEKVGLPARETVKTSGNAESEKAPIVKIQPATDAAKPVEGAATSQAELPDPPKPTALTFEKHSLSSTSYHELLDKYCFVCSGPNKDN